MITIELPWPSSDLSPNARVHWSVKAKATRTARNYAKLYTLYEYSGEQLHRWDNFRCTWTFHPLDLRLRDEDNLVSSMKSARDGVCDALGIDDSQIKETVSRFGEVDRPDGRVVMTLEEM